MQEDDESGMGFVLTNQLNSIQTVSRFFRGFDDAEIQALSSKVTHIFFDQADQLAAVGEEATWVGILLEGKIDAVVDSSVLGTLSPGAIVGEMALFRGGKRMADLIGAGGGGSMASLLFSDLPALFEAHPATAHKLLVAFGAAAAQKLVFPHPTPLQTPSATGPTSSAAVSPAAGKRRSSLESVAQYEAAAATLVRRGLSEAEVAELLRWLTPSEWRGSQVVLEAGKELQHVRTLSHAPPTLSHAPPSCVRPSARGTAEPRVARRVHRCASCSRAS